MKKIFEIILKKLLKYYGFSIIQTNEFNKLEIKIKNLLLEKEKYIRKNSTLSLAITNTPIYIDHQLKLSLKPKGNLLNSCVIISIPKSGTYLAAKILEKIGYIDLEIHASNDYCADYRWMNLENKREHNINYIKGITIQNIVNLVHPGQFFVGHLPFSEKKSLLLNEFRKIFLIRDVRNCLISYMRFCQSKKISGEDEWTKEENQKEKLIKFLQKSLLSKKFFEMAKDVVGWEKEISTLTIKYENLIMDRAGTLKKICLHCGVTISEEKMQEICENAYLEPNITFTGEKCMRSNYSKYWSNKAEILFEEFGGTYLNKIFGYS